MAQPSILSGRQPLAGDDRSSCRVLRIWEVCMRREIYSGSMLDDTLNMDVTPCSRMPTQVCPNFLGCVESDRRKYTKGHGMQRVLRVASLKV